MPVEKVQPSPIEPTGASSVVPKKSSAPSPTVAETLSGTGPTPTETLNITAAPVDIERYFAEHDAAAEKGIKEIDTDLEFLATVPDEIGSLYANISGVIDPQLVGRIRENIIAGKLDADRAKKSAEYYQMCDKRRLAVGAAKESFASIIGTVLTIMGDRVISPVGYGIDAVATGMRDVQGLEDKPENLLTDISGNAVNILKVANLFYAVPQKVFQGGMLGMHAYLIAAVALDLSEMKAQRAEMQKKLDEVVQPVSEEMAQEVEKLKQELKQLDVEIEKVEEWCRVQGKANLEAWAKLGFTTAISLPKWIKTGGTLAKWISLAAGAGGVEKGEEISTSLFTIGPKGFKYTSEVSTVLGYAALFAILAGRSYDLYNVRRDWGKVKGWMADRENREYSDYYRLEFDKFVKTTLTQDATLEGIKNTFAEKGINLHDLVRWDKRAKDRVLDKLQKKEEKKPSGSTAKFLERRKALATPREIRKFLEGGAVAEKAFTLYKQHRVKEEYGKAREEFCSYLQHVVEAKDPKLTAAFQDQYNVKVTFTKEGGVTISYLSGVKDLKVEIEKVDQDQAGELFDKVVGSSFAVTNNVNKLIEKRKRIHGDRKKATAMQFYNLTRKLKADKNVTLEDFRKKGLFYDGITLEELKQDSLVKVGDFTAKLSPKAQVRLRKKYEMAQHLASIVPRADLQKQIQPKDMNKYKAVLAQSFQEYLLANHGDIGARFDGALEQALKAESFEKFMEVLTECGIPLDDLTMADFEAPKDVEFFEFTEIGAKLHDNYVHHGQALSVSAKAAMRTLEAKKANIDKHFWRFDVTTSTLVFAVTLVTTIAVVVACLATGIALSAVFPYVLFGFIALSLTVLVLGFILLVILKPNLANPFLYWYKARIACVKIPRTIQSLRLVWNKVKKAQLSVQIASQPLSKGEDAEMEARKKKALRLHEKMLNVDAKIAKLEGKVAFLEKPLKRWQQKIASKGWKDMGIKPIKDEDFSGALAEAIVSAADYSDPELERMVRKDLGVDLGAMRKEAEKQCKREAEKLSKPVGDVQAALIQEVKGKIQNFFGGMHNELLGLARAKEPDLAGLNDFLGDD